MEGDMKRLVAGLLLFISLIQGCSTFSEGRGIAVSPSRFYERRCGPTLPLEPLEGDSPQVSPERLAALKSQFSPTAFETATALGVLPYLDRLLTLEDQVGSRGEGPALAYVRERRHITDRITLGILDVSSVAVEADCEEGRAALLAEHLQKALAERERGYTVLGYFATGVFTIVGEAMPSGQTASGLSTRRISPRSSP